MVLLNCRRVARHFPLVVAVRAALICLCAACGIGVVADGLQSCEGELLYNNICLPQEWPPRSLLSRVPSHPPYLSSPPALINISVGRQLFVDDFLVDSTLSSADIATRFFQASYDAKHNPVLSATESWECAFNTSAAFASAFSGGVWFDPSDSLFKLWYRCGCFQNVSHCLATSSDGISWEKPVWDVVPETNVVLPGHFDGSTVWLDSDVRTPPVERFKMAVVNPPYKNFTLLSSPDGIHWTTQIIQSGPIADRSTIFFNPFRAKWAFSIKTDFFNAADPHGQLGRSRAYWDGSNLWQASQWTTADLFNWTNADNLDPSVGCGAGSGPSGFTQLYNLDAVAYESVLVGLFSIFTGKSCGPLSPLNRTGEWDSVFLGFSRDGFHWSRPVVDGAHRVFLPMNDTVAPPWVWNKANVQSVGGGFVVLDTPSQSQSSRSQRALDSLRFYVGARSGPLQLEGNATTGVANLRRDGFAAIVSTAGPTTPGKLVTKPVIFDGAHLFVNARAFNNGSSIRVQMLNSTTLHPLSPFLFENCDPIDADTTRSKVSWNNFSLASLQELSGSPVRFEFLIAAPAHLFSFWVSPSACGESMGFVAAGGPTFNGSVDIHGQCR